MEEFQHHELDEIRRSAIDASRRTRSLLADPDLVARYSNPPENTAFHLEYAYHLLGDVRGKQVLDLGCGAGEHALLLATKGAYVIGLDISPELVAIARRRFELNQLPGEFRVSSVYQTDLPDQSIDVVFCMAVLHHLDLTLARREVLRVLKPGGVIILREPVRDSALYAFARNLIPFRRHISSERERPLRKDEIDGFADGLNCDAKRRFKLPFVPLVHLAAPRWLHAAIRLDRWMLRRFPALSHWATVEVRRLRLEASPVETAPGGHET